MDSIDKDDLHVPETLARQSTAELDTEDETGAVPEVKVGGSGGEAQGC